MRVTNKQLKIFQNETIKYANEKNIMKVYGVIASNYETFLQVVEDKLLDKIELVKHENWYEWKLNFSK